jgi:soluble lytic murein transglycosylase-like protein
MTHFFGRPCSRIDAPIKVLGAVAFTVGATVLGTPTLATEVPFAPAKARSNDPSQFGVFISEASDRFSISQIWIHAVINQESGGIVRIVSPKGAIGLMQVMPETYLELARRYRLGPDPFNPHDNILAGTAYLREMRDRFGSPGFLAAYNAGPRRYEQHLSTGRPLPDETIAYLATASRTTNITRSVASNRAKNLSRGPNSKLFALRSRARINVDLTAVAPPTDYLLFSHSNAGTLHADGLFVARAIAGAPH